MSFPFRDRDRPSLRDRLKGFGRAGDEIMEQLKQSLDEDRKNFFESNSKFGRPSGFSRGFPFDDDVMHGKSKLKDHLEDLAKRHPELADQLKDWADIERSPKIPRASGGLGGQETAGDADQQRVPQQQQTTDGQGPSRAPNLRATVPDMQAQQEKMDQQRNQRSQSAPPEGPPVKGAVPAPADPNSTQQPNENNQNHQHQKQNNGPQNNQSPQQPQQQQQSRSNERYIPIFVEGRGETIVNVPAQNDKAQPQPQPATQTPPPRQKKAAYQKSPSAGATPSAPQPSPAASASAPSPQAAPCQEAVPPPQSEPQTTAAPPPQPPRPPSPLTQVANIQKEVEDLRQRVEAFKGAKTDKEYIYLDEMLTRNLLKLDNIDSEGRDEVRAARKEVIRCIQQCINTLEMAPSNP